MGNSLVSDRSYTLTGYRNSQYPPFAAFHALRALAH